MCLQLVADTRQLIWGIMLLAILAGIGFFMSVKNSLTVTQDNWFACHDAVIYRSMVISSILFNKVGPLSIHRVL